MPVSLSLNFLWGRYHATAWNSYVNDGIPEWPPSPWRLLRALISQELNVSSPVSLESQAVLWNLMEKLAKNSPLYLLPPKFDFHTRHYFPGNGNKPTANLVLDASAVLPYLQNKEKIAPVYVSWEDIDLSTEEQALLEKLCSKISYLGRAESICEVVPVEEADLPNQSDFYQKCAPKSAVGEVDKTEYENIEILCVAPEIESTKLPEVLIARSREVRAKQHRRLPPGTVLIPYLLKSVPSSSPPRSKMNRRNQPDKITVVRFNISTNAKPSVKSTVIMAEALRSAAMSKFGSKNRDSSGQNGKTQNLSGKDAEGILLSGEHTHAHYLALSSKDNRLLDKLVIWCPAGFTEEEILALSNLRELGGKGFMAARDFRPCRLGLEGYGSTQEAIPSLIGPSKVWRSRTPFAPAWPPEWRSPKNMTQIRNSVKKECQHRGLPEPIDIDHYPGRNDWNSYRTHRHTGKGRGLKQARFATGLQLTFQDEIEGPLSLGALSHFGLGLFEPLP